MNNLNLRRSTVSLCFLIGGLVAALMAGGCKKEETYDNAMLEGTKSGAKAIGAKMDGQKRVDNATAILDGK
jgi:hypothetical protein